MQVPRVARPLLRRAGLWLGSVALGVGASLSAAAQTATPPPPPPPPRPFVPPPQPAPFSAMPLPPAFAQPPYLVPPRKPLENERKVPDESYTPPLHGRVAPGFDLQTVMSEVGSRGPVCTLRFAITDIGDLSFQMMTMGLWVVPTRGAAHRTELELRQPLLPEHEIKAELEVATPCDQIREIRLGSFTQCIVDNVATGVCRPLMLMRSTSRISFGL